MEDGRIDMIIDEGMRDNFDIKFLWGTILRLKASVRDQIKLLVGKSVSCSIKWVNSLLINTYSRNNINGVMVEQIKPITILYNIYKEPFSIQIIDETLETSK